MDPWFGRSPRGPMVRDRIGRGLSVVRIGAGPPLVVAPGLAPDHGPLRGVGLGTGLISLWPFARDRTVWWVNRREGLDPGTTMAELAADYSGALRSAFDGPVDVMGISTGGAVALQLAADDPALVRRLVVVASGGRLGERGRAAQRRMAAHLAAHRPRAAAAELGAMVAATRRSRAGLRVAGWLTGGAFWAVDDPRDVLATIWAEDGFDLTDRLGEITAPTLVVGGGRDQFYDNGRVTAATARGIGGSTLVVYPDKGHLGVLNSPALPRDVLAFLAAGPYP